MESIYAWTKFELFNVLGYNFKVVGFQIIFIDFFVLIWNFISRSLGIRKRRSQLNLPFLFITFWWFFEPRAQVWHQFELVTWYTFFPLDFMGFYLFFIFFKKNHPCEKNNNHPLIGCNFFIHQKKLVESFINK